MKLFHIIGLILVNGEKPNVLVILLDDLGWADVSWNNHKVVATPFLEEMARNGTILVRNKTFIIIFPSIPIIFNNIPSNLLHDKCISHVKLRL